MRLLASTTQAPMRIVTGLSIFGAVANLVYGIYVTIIALLKNDVAPGWVSLSLQQSGMFFLICLVLLVLGEYILNMVSLSNEDFASWPDRQQWLPHRILRQSPPHQRRADSFPSRSPLTCRHHRFARPVGYFLDIEFFKPGHSRAGELLSHVVARSFDFQTISLGLTVGTISVWSFR
ncbi:hypothetical protein [Pseudomonas sp. GM25]